MKKKMVLCLFLLFFGTIFLQTAEATVTASINGSQITYTATYEYPHCNDGGGCWAVRPCNINTQNCTYDGGYGNCDFSFSTSTVFSGTFDVFDLYGCSLYFSGATGVIFSVTWQACSGGDRWEEHSAILPYDYYQFCTCYDNDGDGYSAISTNCRLGNDCNDNDPTIYPGAVERCDGKDNNCDGQIDDTCNGGDDKCIQNSNSTNIGSSASLSSGNLYHSQTLFQTQNHELKSAFILSYNSLDTAIGPLGRGWMHNYNTNITENTGRIILMEEDGRRVYFSSSNGVTYSPDASSGKHATITKNLDGTYILTEKSGIKYNYNSSGKLTSIADRNNNALTLTYTGTDLTSITDSSGRQITLIYDLNHKITSITDAAGRTTTFTYNSNFLSTVRDSLGATWTFTYDANGRMLTKTDPLGRTTTYTYDSYGKLISSQDSNNNIKTISYDQTNKTAIVTEKNASHWTYKYDNALNVPTEVTDPSLNQTTYQYDLNRNLRSETKNGITTTYTYDTDGNMLTKTEAYGSTNQRTTSYTYNSFGQALTMTDPDGNTTTYTYDVNGNLLQEKDAQNNITSHTYDSKGQKLTDTNPRGNMTTYTYDSYGNIASVKNALNQITTYSYDIMGNLLSMTDANGNTTTYQYDLKDRLIRQTNPDGGAINYEYDLAGNRTAITDANGNRTTFTYDGLNRLTKTTDLSGNSINYTYDAEGNMTSMTIKDSTNNVKTSDIYTYDIYNRLIKTTHADSTYTEQLYDISGNIATKIDENRFTTTYNHDNLNRLYEVINARGIATWYYYDKRNNLTSVRDGSGKITSYIYNNLNRLFSTISPDTGTTTYTYDSNGNMITKTDANNVTTTYVYDALNRQITIQFPDSIQNINYYYDDPQNQNSKGRLTAMTDQSGTTWYDYDKMGRVVMETRQVNNLNYRTEYLYDLNGNVSSITYPGGRKIAYTYNQQNKVTSVAETFAGVTKTLANNITYLPFGDITSMTQSNGIITTKTYNNRYQSNNLTVGTLKNLSYARDNAGNITQITDNLSPSNTRIFSYDRVYQLASASGPWRGFISYGQYDLVGNRTIEMTFTGNTTYTYTTNTNKLASTAGLKTFNFSYDNNGNTTAENSRQFIYNQNQRMIRVTDTTGTVAEYIYNGNGQRADKLIPSENKCTVFHYDQNGLLITESTRTGNIKAEYVYLNGQPLAKIEGNAIYYYHDDHLGTPILMTSESSSVVWTGEYLPFGEPLSVSGTITNNLRFPGQYFDSETGLHQNYFRDYKAEIGRYGEADPILQPMVSKTTKLGCSKSTVTWRVPLLISNPQDLYPYVYTKANPINLMDPLGLECGSGWTDKIVPDSYGNFNFTRPCENHDKCYDTCSKSQLECAATFFTDMMRECSKLTWNPISQFSCIETATIYATVVASPAGYPAYNKAQKKACCKK